MDFETAEHLVIPVITALVGGFVAWLKLRGDSQKTQIDRLTATRDDSRDDFQAVMVQSDETIKRLDERVKRLEQELDAERKRRIALEQDVSQLRMIYRLLRRTVLTECEQGTDCPLWRYLDDREREQMVADLLETPATVGGQKG